MSLLRPIHSLAVLIVLLVVPRALLGSSVVQLAPEQTLGAADAIFEGTVESARSYHFDGQNGAILTDYVVSVTRILNDQGDGLAARMKDGRVVLTFCGGKVGDIEDVVHGVPTFVVGDQAFFLINRQDWNATSPIVGVWQGVYRQRNGRIWSASGCCGAEALVRSHYFSNMVTAPEGFTADEFAGEIARALPLARRQQSAAGAVEPADHTHVEPVSIRSAEAKSGNLTDAADDPVSVPRLASGGLKDAAGAATPTPPSELVFVDRPEDRSEVRAGMRPRYGFIRLPPGAPVTWNIPPSMGSFAAEAQNLLAYWNAHADIYRYYTSPTNTINTLNTRYEMGFASNPTMLDQVGRSWNSGELGLCYTRYVFDVPLVSDIFFRNDGSTVWSSDYLAMAAASVSNPNCASGSCGIPTSFVAVCLHELGHGFSLEHQWIPSPGSRFPSVMNYYSVNEIFDTAFIFADDAMAIRAAYPSRAAAFTNGLIKLWFNTGMLVTGSTGQTNGRQFTLPATTVQRGATLAIGTGTGAGATFFTVENTGTTAFTSRIDYYLTPGYGDFSGSIYLGSTNLGLMAPNSSGQFQRTVTIPTTVPPGQYFVAAALTLNGDQNGFDNAAWNFNPVTITVPPPPVPSNNNWWQAAVIDSHGGTYTGTTLGATWDLGGACGTSTSTPDVWYTITPASTGTLLLETCGSSYDTVVEFFRTSTLASIGCNDDALVGPCAGSLQSRLLVNVTQGINYLIRASGYNGNTGNFSLTAQLYPVNDNCWTFDSGGPVASSATASLSTGRWVSGTTIGATRTLAGFVPACPLQTSLGSENLEANGDVWYQWVPACTGPATVVTVSSALLQVAVYNGCYQLTLISGTTPSLVACGALENGFDNPYAHFNAVAGAVYYVRVLNYNIAADFQVIVGQSANNDYCAGAGPAAVNVSTSPANVICDGGCAAPTPDVLAPAACGDAVAAFDMGPDTFRQLNIQSTGTLRVTRCSGTYLPVVVLYPSCPDGGTTVQPLVCGFSNSQLCDPVIISYPVVAGQQLIMRVGGNTAATNGGVGVTTLTLSVVPAPIGACCQIDGTCVPSAAPDCVGIFSGNGTSCTPNPCVQPTGACCTGTTCSITTSAGCAAGGGVFTGIGQPCLGQPGNRITCCPANFNGEGGPTVQDVFDFLAAYFSGDPRADFNHSGGITVQDIFDFLAAYFLGC